MKYEAHIVDVGKRASKLVTPGSELVMDQIKMVALLYRALHRAE